MAPRERERVVLSRREFLEVAAAGAAGAAAASGCAPPPGPCAPAFFNDEERRALATLADLVLPPDEDPGGAGLGAVEYIEAMLTALECRPPRVHAGGPFSGRRPFAAADGTPSDRRPRNAFARFVPLDRVREAAWRIRLYGTAEAGSPEGVPPVEGLRVLVRRGLERARALAGGPIDALGTDAIEALWEALPAEFRDAVVELVVEAAFAAPEYGGNRDLAGWRLASFPGDSQPLGWSLWDEEAGRYRELADAPVSMSDPAPDPAPMDAETRATLDLVARSLGGRVRG